MMPLMTANHIDNGLLFDPDSAHHRRYPYATEFGFVSPNGLSR
jgi:hypothetical protein